MITTNVLFAFILSLTVFLPTDELVLTTTSQQTVSASGLKILEKSTLFHRGKRHVLAIEEETFTESGLKATRYFLANPDMDAPKNDPYAAQWCLDYQLVGVNWLEIGMSNASVTICGLLQERDILGDKVIVTDTTNSISEVFEFTNNRSELRCLATKNSTVLAKKNFKPQQEGEIVSKTEFFRNDAVIAREIKVVGVFFDSKRIELTLPSGKPYLVFVFNKNGEMTCTVAKDVSVNFIDADNDGKFDFLFSRFAQQQKMEMFHVDEGPAVRPIDTGLFGLLHETGNYLTVIRKIQNKERFLEEKMRELHGDKEK